MVVAERLRDLVRRQPMEVDGSTFVVTVCIGGATCPIYFFAPLL